MSIAKVLESDPLSLSPDSSVYSSMTSGKLPSAFELVSHLCVHAKLLQSWPTFCDPMDCSSPGSSVHGILQARILEWVAMPCLPDPGIEPMTLTSPALADGFFTTSATWEALSRL